MSFKYVTFISEKDRALFYKSKEVNIVINSPFIKSIKGVNHLAKRKPLTKQTRKVPNEDYSRFVIRHRLSIPEASIPSYLSTALDSIDIPSSYSVFKIPKASGGMRTIKAPSDELKGLQTILKNYLENYLKIQNHNNAYAYTKNRSVYDAVAVHQENESRWFLKIDLKDFFDHTTPEVLVDKLSNVHPIAGMKEEDKTELLDLLLKASFLDGGLPQGTPLSPTLTNIVMTEFDFAMTQYAYANNMRYTRYADDLIISATHNFKYTKVVNVINKILKDRNYPYTINNKKTRYGSSAGSNWNLGLMLNKDNEITVGHKQKKRLKNSLGSFYKDQTQWSMEEVYELNGQLEWLRSNEPEYHKGMIDWFNKKYQCNIIKDLRARI